MKEDIVKRVADKLIGTEILGLDINGQWYDSIKNGGKPIKNPFTKKNNTSLHSAKKEKNDEFYTQLEDIEKECIHYAKHFKDKIVLCNCNDVLHKNFTLYFYRNFKTLGLKKLIATGYKVDGEHGKVCSYDGNEWTMKMLEGDGGYSTDECIELLKESDIVVTNPPFSLFRDYVALLMRHNKKFLIIGNMNAITYKEIFPLIQNDEIWLGIKNINTDMAFKVPPYYEEKSCNFWIDENGQKWRSLGNSCWFTNIDHNKTHEKIGLTKKYNENEYQKYDNYDAIEVSKVTDIPMDYDGVMGVPITFLGKYCPEQFKIEGIMTGAKGKPFTNGNDGRAKFYVNKHGVYARILIRRILT